MKILLVNPFNAYDGKYDNNVLLNRGVEAEIPLGICYLKAYLKKYLPDIEVSVYDANIDAVHYVVNVDKDASMDILWQRVRDKIKSVNPDLVGISGFSHAVAGEVHKLAHVCKAINDKIITVAGGPYATLSFAKVMEDKNIDFVVLSEGEIVFSNLVKAITGKKKCADIKGLVYREEGKIVANSQEKPIEDLDTLPFPDLDDIPVMEYGKLGRHAYHRLDQNIKPMWISTARGCIFNCGFCATKRMWGSVRYRTPKNIIAELKWLKQKYDFDYVQFNDDLFSHDAKRVIELCDLLIKEKLVKHFIACGVTVQSLTNREMVAKMVEAGYDYFTLTIESGSENTLKLIKKPLQYSAIEKVVKILREFKNVYVSGVFITGFPFETKDDIEKTFSLARSLNLNWVSFNIFNPFPETPLYDYCIEHGYLNDHQFTYRTFQDTVVLSTPNFDKEWLRDYSYYNNLKVNFVFNYALRNKNYELAKNEFLLILNMAPEHAFAALFLGYACDKLGEKDKAKLYYERAKNIFMRSEFWRKYYELLGKDIFNNYKISGHDWIEDKLADYTDTTLSRGNLS